MARHSYSGYVPLSGTGSPLLNPDPRAAMPCTKTKHALYFFGALAAVLFVVAYWPSHIHGTGLRALAGHASHTMTSPQSTAARLPSILHRQQHGQPAEEEFLKQQDGSNTQLIAAADGQLQQKAAADGLERHSKKVKLELFVMSLCPDAKYCEHFFDDLLEKINPIVEVETQ